MYINFVEINQVSFANILLFNHEYIIKKDIIKHEYNIKLSKAYICTLTYVTQHMYIKIIIKFVIRLYRYH